MVLMDTDDNLSKSFIENGIILQSSHQVVTG